MITGNLPKECKRSTTGGKGNRGRYFERDPRICAAGLATAQGDLSVESAMHQYLLSDEVRALVSDAIVPPPPPRKHAPLRHPIEGDQRHCGLNSELTDIVNPPEKTKFQELVDELKTTVYKSYWRVPLGQVPDPIPQFPTGYDFQNTTFGIKTVADTNLYDSVFPKHPLPDKTRPCKEAGYQTDRNYCRPAYNPDLTFGHRSYIDKRGISMKCCLTDDRVVTGTANRTVIGATQADLDARKYLVAQNQIKECNSTKTQEDNDDAQSLLECLSTCKINPNLKRFRKCLEHLNSLRKIMSTRFLPTFFKKCYLDIKYYDIHKTEWVPKNVVYDYCASKLIRFDPVLIEPLLCMWEAFDGKNVKYKTFFHILNFKQPLPDLPKVPDIHPDCLDFRTTYGEMVKPGQARDERRAAGIPSGRYLDMDYPSTPVEYCDAAQICLPYESDVYSCIKPSIFTLFHVSHREMYAVRDPVTVKKVFEAAGEMFPDDRFNQAWEEAKKYHPKGWVCYETFRRALEKFPLPKE